MLKRLIYNNKAFKMIDNFKIKSSNSDVTFNNIKIDFTGYSLEDIPFKYQKIEVRQAETEDNIFNGEILFTGFFDNIDLPDMKMREEDRFPTLTLLSPLKMATKRTVSLIGTYNKETAIRRVLQPLIDDGFKIAEINVPDGQITTNYVLETVENCMNRISTKLNIFWYIDEKCNIYINSIDYLFGLEPKKIIENAEEENGLVNIKPKIENVDYANVINIKNIRLFDYSRSMSIGSTVDKIGYSILELPKYINGGDVINFINPIVIDEETTRMILNKDGEDNIEYDQWFYALRLQIRTGTSPNFSYYAAEIYIDLDRNSSTFMDYIISSNISFSDSDGTEKVFVLQRDSFFQNLITGFKWNGADNAKIEIVESNLSLRYTTMKFMYSPEINKLKNIISASGQVEKTVDYQSKWTTDNQIIEYARSLIVQNSNVVNQVTLKYDENPNLKIGDIVVIDEPDFYIQGKFAVKETTYTHKNDLDETWDIILKSTDFISSYIDLFRPIEKQESQDKIDTVILSEFIEEKINEIHEINFE